MRVAGEAESFHVGVDGLRPRVRVQHHICARALFGSFLEAVAGRFLLRETDEEDTVLLVADEILRQPVRKCPLEHHPARHNVDGGFAERFLKPGAGVGHTVLVYVEDLEIRIVAGR